MKRILYFAFAILAVGSLCPASAAEIAQPASAVPTVLDAVATTDLDLDTTFGSGGWTIADFNDANGMLDQGMRTFSRCTRVNGVCQFPVTYSYYLVGKHAGGPNWSAVVARLDENGFPIASFGSGGKLTVPTSMRVMADVAFDPVAGRLYFVGAQPVFVTTDLQFSVFCLDLATGAGCVGFGNPGNTQGYQYVVFDLGGNNDDIAESVLFDPAGFLYVAGKAASPTGAQIAVAKLSAANGALVSAFGGIGQAHFDIGLRSADNDVDVLDMALRNGASLYLAGAYRQPAGDYDGYAFSLEAATADQTHLRRIAAESDNLPVPENDAITAITVLANGDIAMAGYSDTAVARAPALLLAKTTPSLVLDDRFCGAGICVKEVGDGAHGWQDTYPRALAERPGDRDLVVALQAGTWTYDFAANRFELREKQVVQQFSASGITLHASRELEFPAFVDGSGTDARASFTAGMNVSNGVVELVGSRKWSDSDSDITMTRMLANDAIFADRFGGASGD